MLLSLTTDTQCGVKLLWLQLFGLFSSLVSFPTPDEATVQQLNSDI